MNISSSMKNSFSDFNESCYSGNGVRNYSDIGLNIDHWHQTVIKREVPDNTQFTHINTHTQFRVSAKKANIIQGANFKAQSIS